MIRHCLCRGTSRFYSTQCPDISSHGVWADQDWHSEDPVYAEPYIFSARRYRDDWMAQHGEPLMAQLWGSWADATQLPESTFTPRTRREPYAPPRIPAPVLPAVEITEHEEDHIPPNAAKLARAGAAAGWDVRVTFAIGPVINADGSLHTDPIWRVDVDEGSGKQHKTKVGETDPGQQPSIGVRLARPDSIFVGLWLGGNMMGPRGGWSGAEFQHGVVAPPWRRVNWATLWQSWTERDG